MIVFINYFILVFERGSYSLAQTVKLTVICCSSLPSDGLKRVSQPPQPGLRFYFIFLDNEMKIHLSWYLFLFFDRMPLSHFASRLRKDLSTEMIRTSIAHRKSLSQKENRHKVYERNRHFGLRDVNIPLEGRDLVNIPELPQSLAPEKASTKTSK